jgi:hypothetical protein
VAEPIRVYVERGSKRVFAASLDWPGWCRSSADEAAALETLTAYGPRYARAIGRTARVFGDPVFEVTERLRGDATTDFGAPSIEPRSDARALERGELARLRKLLQACWTAFDGSADAHRGLVLRKGPRGGGRKVDEIESHVVGADAAYMSRIGGTIERSGDERFDVRRAFLDALDARARGEPPPPNPRRKKPLWTPRYAIRRSAWHALDHAWEIEDRASP